MNIGLTGHTKGLGKTLVEYFSKNFEIKGFSRSSGYDIKNPFDRKKIIKECIDYNIFINLAHNYYHQTDLLFEFFKSWQGQKKLIINISSIVVDDDSWGLDRFDHIEYKNQKICLETMSSILNKNNIFPLIKNYRISEINFKEDFKNLNNIINEFILS
jgi:hypothetical protein